MTIITVCKRSLRKVAEKGVRLKGDTIMLFRLSGELPIMGSWHGMIKTRRRCVILVEFAILLIVRAVGTLPFYCGVPTARCFFFLGALFYQSVVPIGTFSARQGEQLKTALKAQNIIAQRRVSDANGSLGVRSPHRTVALKAQKNESWRVALSGRCFLMFAQYPRRRCACLELCVNCPFGAFFFYPN